jgi:hypothetical protein
MNSHKIKISVNDIFDYVVGSSNYDPIERCIDPTRFEVFDFGIYDNQNKKTIQQDDKFKFFCSEVSKLRFIAKEMDPREIQSVCNELEQVAPTEINLG